MANLPALTLPADAAAKAEEKAKTTDFYADLTDEEREEEGLPPRDPSPEKAPGGDAPGKSTPPTKAPPAEDETPKKGEDGDDDEAAGEQDEDEEFDEEYDADSQKLFDEIAKLREDIGAPLGKSETAPTAKGEDALLTSLLESDDPEKRALGARLQKMEERLEARETEARADRIAAQAVRDDADFDAVQNAYLIDGKPMTDKHVEQVEKFIVKNPGVAGLSIEQVTRAVFPSAMRRPKPAPAKRPAGSPNGDGPVATIVEEGSSGGAPSGPFKPRPNETIESAIAAAGQRFGWKR